MGAREYIITGPAGGGTPRINHTATTKTHNTTQHSTDDSTRDRGGDTPTEPKQAALLVRREACGAVPAYDRVEHAASVFDAGETPPRGIKPDIRPSDDFSGPRRRCLPLFRGTVLDAPVSHWAGGRRESSRLNRSLFGVGDGSRRALRGSGNLGEIRYIHTSKRPHNG